MDQETLQAIDRDIGLFIAVIGELLTQDLLDEVCHEQITVGQARCLCFILAHEKVTVGDLSRGLGISYPAATKNISRLVEKGLAARRADKADRRNVFVEITAKGQELTGKIKPEKLKRLSSLLRKVDPERIRDLQKGIEAFLTATLAESELAENICLHCGREHVEHCILANIKCLKRVISY
ncbi:MAG: MarR family winged helix-turn-helix transcriptional regulator [Thermincola sp.]|jgi:DNA-binding MarR family transcriptional regulator|nr:MarR family winged helix-turn-helix transcriptional regulator [Thermincola sp.]MDT3703322.1 MarR family winged helix-turn-helix transcriptional regulator [Thermincola sp.]